MPDHYDIRPEHRTIEYAGVTIEYYVHRSARRKATTEIRVRHGRVQVFVPHTMDGRLVHDLVRDRAGWILEERAKEALAPSTGEPAAHHRSGFKIDRDSIEHLGTTIEYQTIRSRRRKKTMQVSVSDEGVRVQAPWTATDGDLKEFVRDRASWIIDRLARLAKEPLRFVDGERLPYLGRPIPMEFDTAHILTPEIGFDQRRFTVRVPPELAGDQRLERIGEAFKDWFSKRAMEWIPAAVDRWRHVLWFGPDTTVLIRDQRRRWASCAIDGTLRFNWRVMMLDEDLIDYVVVHELAHLQVRNHSADFWKVVRNVLPDVQERRSRLKEVGAGLPL